MSVVPHPPPSSPLRWFWGFVRPHRAVVAGSVVAGIARYNIPLLVPWGVKVIVDEIVSGPGGAASAERIGGVVAVLLGVYGVWALATVARVYLTSIAAHRIVHDLRLAVHERVLGMSLGFFEKRKSGGVAARLMHDVNHAQNLVGMAFTNTVLDASALVTILVLIASLDPHLTLAALSVVPCYVLISKHYGRKIRVTSRQVHDQVEAISGDLSERFGNVPVVQAFNHELHEQGRFREQCVRLHTILRAHSRHEALCLSLTATLTSVAPILVVWWGALQALEGNLTVGGLTAFYAYLGLLYNPINRLAELNVLVGNSLSAIDRLHELWTTPPEVRERPGARRIDRGAGRIEFAGVHFAYEPDRPVLCGVDLTIERGRTVALVGPSGAGKTTMARLVLRFHDVSAGSLTVDRIDVRDLTLHSLRGQIALVPQEPALFSGTIAANIRFGGPDAGDDAVERAAENAHAHAFIRELPSGYRTEVGERGLALSAGQKQRIAIARAFLKDAPILILDEPTSALDAESEALVRDALGRLAEGRTTVVIAHRLSTIRDAHRIVFVAGGVVREEGSHQELLSRPDGLYLRFFSTYAFGAPDSPRS